MKTYSERMHDTPMSNTSHIVLIIVPGMQYTSVTIKNVITNLIIVLLISIPFDEKRLDDCLEMELAFFVRVGEEIFFS